jgi:serine phosphatase RsbU (regulator of sigma subunit)
MLNKLLERQLRRYIKTADVSGPEFQNLFTAISQAYDHHEEDRQLIERSLELSSQELSDSNRALMDASRIIELKNKDMISSLEYARLVQNSLLAKESTIFDTFKNAFIFNRPRDIVGGDFFWIREEKGKIFLATADCTGHGVPGAFMSVISFRLLNQAVRDYGISSTAQILGFLNEEINSTLSSRSGEADTKDALDISLVSIDRKRGTIEFSGVGHRILVCNGKDNVREFKGDRTHIGQNLSTAKNPISSQEFDYSDGEVLYMYSDGYGDQFGGEEQKKFGATRLKNLLSEVSGLDFTQQRAQIESSFLNWKDTNMQIDDVLVLGIGLSTEN